jgi:DNA-binding NtrC family response regulator
MGYTGRQQNSSDAETETGASTLAELQASIAAAIKQEYRFFDNVPELMRCFCQVLVTATDSARGEVLLKETALQPYHQEGLRSVVVGESEQHLSIHPNVEDCPVCAGFYAGIRQAPLIVHDLREEPHCGSLIQPFGSALSVPIHYQNMTLGVINLTSPFTEHYSPSYAAAAQTVTSTLIRHLKRFEADRLAKIRFCRDLLLVGSSDALRQVDEFIEKASRVDLPVLIVGEFGVEKEHLAYALHLMGPRRQGPFIEVRCAALPTNASKLEFLELLRKADQGTIWFQGIEELAYPLQLQLLEILDSGVGEWAYDAGAPKCVHTRIIISADARHNEPLRNERFSPQLLTKLVFLSVSIAPLIERKDDIKPLIQYFLKKYALEQTLLFTDDALALCESYSWPENVYELERVVARVAIIAQEMTTAKDIHVKPEDLLRVLPELGGARHRGVSSLTYSEAEEGQDVGNYDALRVHLLARQLVGKQPVGLNGIHPGLQRALTYLVQNYSKDISLDRLAQHACVSISHLCYLFRKELKANFKAVLSAIRIEEAKQLLLEKPNLTVTQISIAIGFSDPRQYQRLFKKTVGCTSKEYKLMQGIRRG